MRNTCSSRQLDFIFPPLTSIVPKEQTAIPFVFADDNQRTEQKPFMTKEEMARIKEEEGDDDSTEDLY